MRTTYHHLALGESVLVVEDVDSFIHSHQTHSGPRVSSDLQTEVLAGGVDCSRARGFHFQLKREKKRGGGFQDVKRVPVDKLVKRSATITKIMGLIPTSILMEMDILCFAASQFE